MNGKFFLTFFFSCVIIFFSLKCLPDTCPALAGVRGHHSVNAYAVTWSQNSDFCRRVEE